MQVMLEEDGFDDRLGFSDEATFHLTGKVNKYNTRIWGTEHPHSTLKHVRDSAKPDFGQMRRARGPPSCGPRTSFNAARSLF